jgi:hypothetical protein
MKNKYYVYGVLFGLLLKVAAVVGLATLIIMALIKYIKS